jgi:hypothetical protein
VFLDVHTHDREEQEKEERELFMMTSDQQNFIKTTFLILCFFAEFRDKGL